jgi:hypothetical protein
MQLHHRTPERLYSGFEVREHARVQIGDNHYYPQRESPVISSVTIGLTIKKH